MGDLRRHRSGHRLRHVRGRPQLLSSAFIPLFGRKRAEGGFGKAIDILAIFATLFGSAASLGLGALQIGGGLIAGGFHELRQYSSADRPC